MRGQRTDGHSALEHLQSDLGPLADGLEVDTTVDQRLREVSTTGAKSVGPDRDGTRGLVGIEERDGLRSPDEMISSSAKREIWRESKRTSETGKS